MDRGELSLSPVVKWSVVAISRNGAERNGTELGSKMRNGTGLKCGTAKLRMRTRGAGFGGKVRSTACEVEDEQVGGLSCFSYPLSSIGSHSAAEEAPRRWHIYSATSKAKGWGDIHLQK